MKRAFSLFTCIAFILVLAGGLCAAPPEKVVLNAKPGNITFPHQKHAETLKIPCKTCHHTLKEGETPVKCITCHGVDAKAPKPQDAFHKRCQGCHKDENEKNAKNAPTKCTQCHVKA
jgi:hypothetical protein